MKRIVWFLIIALTIFTINGDVALPPKNYWSTLSRYKNEFKNKIHNFVSCIKGENCSPERKKAYRVVLGLATITLITMIGGSTFYILRQKRNKLQKELMESIVSNNMNQFKKLVDSGMNLNFTDKETPLDQAIIANNIAMVAQLLNAGADIKQGYPLVYAVNSGDMQMINLLIERGADVNKSSPYALGIAGTPLMVAITSELSFGNETRKTTERMDIIKRLIEAGADVNGEDMEGNSVIHVAVTYGSPELVKYLIENGIDVNKESRHARYGHTTPLVRASQREEADSLEKIKLLVEAGADVNKHAPLAKAAGEGFIEAVLYLVKKGADINNGNPLIKAVQSGEVEIVQSLLEQGASVNSLDSYGANAYMYIGPSIESKPKKQAAYEAINKLLEQYGAEFPARRSSGSDSLTNAQAYKILGLSPTASDLDVKTAYKKLAIKYHPDKNKSSGAEEQFKKINQAYIALMGRRK